MISDTHGGQLAFGPLKGDVLIHCGDIENLFTPDVSALERMDEWFGQQSFDKIFCIGGNHDKAIDTRLQFGVQPFHNAICLKDETITYAGVNFHGSPWVPELPQHAFYASEYALKSAWAKIPDDVDVLITHTPPKGVLDVSSRGDSLGCPHLAQRVRQVDPILHCFGHVHAAAGHLVQGPTTFVNATSVDSSFTITHQPFVFDL